MRLLHTSDWHLGKKLYRLDRFEEHELFLNWILGQLQTERIDHLLMSGDLFDSPQPPHKSLKQFYQFIKKVLDHTSVEVWLIGGNHDSSVLLEAPGELLGLGRIHFCGSLKETPSEHHFQLKKEQTTVELTMLPFFRQHELFEWQEALKEKSGKKLETIPELLEAFLKSNQQTSLPKILMGHHLFGLFEAAGSEQALSLSGLDSIPLEWTTHFDYLALGHIHKPQILRRKNPLAIYSGSPLALRFSETKPKEIQILDFIGTTFTHQMKAIPIWRKLVSLTIPSSDWQAPCEEWYKNLVRPPLGVALEILVEMESSITGLFEQIRNWCEEKKVDLLILRPVFTEGEMLHHQDQMKDVFSMSPEQIFEAYYALKFPDSPLLPEHLKLRFHHLLGEAQHAAPRT